MVNFFYTAKSLDGRVKTGTAEAKDVEELAQRLKGEGLFLAQADSGAKKAKSSLSIPFLSRKVSVTEKMLMTRNLSVMVSRGLPLVKGFTILAAQAKSKKMKEALTGISQEVSKGVSLADSFKKYPDVFSELFQSMIQAGEESGTLEEVLAVLALQLEKEKAMNSKIQKALIYPVILVVVMFIVTITLSIFVLPKMNEFFKGMNAELPITTKIILGSGDFFLNYWYIMVAVIFALIFVFSAAMKSKKGRFVIDTLALRVPLISSLIEKANTASLIRSLSSLLSAGVALIRSLDITAGIVSNFYFKQALAVASKKIAKGEKLSVSLEPSKDIFPYGALEMIEIGEETGKTSLILKKLAEFYEEEVSNAAENFSVIIEPVLIIVIGLAVGVFAVSIMGPMYSVLGNVQ